jgi:hypothetical protein
VFDVELRFIREGGMDQALLAEAFHPEVVVKEL